MRHVRAVEGKVAAIEENHVVLAQALEGAHAVIDEVDPVHFIGDRRDR